MKRILAMGLSAVLAVGMLTGCSGEKAAESGKTKIRVGIVTNTMGVPAAYALEKGYYTAEGLEVEPVIFSSGSVVNEAFAAGEIDVAFSGLASIFSLATGNASWIGEVNTTNGLGIYVRPDSPILQYKGEVPGYENVYGSADTLKGVKILGPLGNVAQYCSSNWVRIFGLEDKDVEIVNMDYGPAYQAFVSGQGDAVSINNPYTFMAEEQGFVCAATFEDATKTDLYDGIFASTKFVEGNRDAMVGFIKATYKAMDELQDDKVRFDFSMKWFKDNGKEYTAESMNQEISLRRYINSDFMKKDTFVFGSGMTQIADFYVQDGMIKESGTQLILKGIDPSLINDALGLQLKSAGTK